VKELAKKKSSKEAMAFIKGIMQPHGMGCGYKILEVAKKLHPNFAYGVPLYRSAMAVLKQTRTEKKNGSCTIVLYHDPHWMGEPDITEDNLPKYKEVIKVYGQRSGPDITRNDKMLTEEWRQLQYCARCMESPYVSCPVCGDALVPSVGHLSTEGCWSHLSGKCDYKKWPRMSMEGFNMKSLLPFEVDWEGELRKQVEENKIRDRMNNGGM
jgi:hypothetical protein